MAPNDTPSGHLGNLSADQEIALKKIWSCFYALDGGKGGDEKKSAVAVDISEALKFVRECGGYEKFHLTFWASPFAGHPDATMLRFLRARKFDVTASIAMLACMIKWRIDVDADKVIEQGEEILNRDMPGFDLQMKSGKTYIHGADKQNRPIFYIHAQLHDPKLQSFETLVAFTIYGVETGRMFLAPPTNQYCLLFDMTGFGLRNMDWTYMQFLVKAFEAYYPETLGTLVIHKAPWIFGGIWRALRPLLDPVVASKFVFTRTDEELFEIVHPDQLLKSLGGNLDWTWSYPDCIDGENSRCNDEKLKNEWLLKRAAARQRLEDATKAWLVSDEKDVLTARDMAFLDYRITTIEADPYIRPRNVYHRHKNLLEDGTIYWHYESAADDQVWGTPLSKLKEMLHAGEGTSAIPEMSGAASIVGDTTEEAGLPSTGSITAGTAI